MCRRRRSSRPRSRKNSEILRRTAWSGSLKETPTRKSPTSGSPSTRASSSASRAGALSARSFGSSYASVATMSASRRAVAGSVSGMTLDPRVDEALALLVRDAGQLEHVAVELDADAAQSILSQPRAHCLHDGRERVLVPDETNEDGARDERLDGACALRCRLRPGALDRVDVEVEQLGPKAGGELVELVCVRAAAGVDGQLELGGFAHRTAASRRTARRCYSAH